MTDKKHSTRAGRRVVRNGARRAAMLDHVAAWRRKMTEMHSAEGREVRRLAPVGSWVQMRGPHRGLLRVVDHGGVDAVCVDERGVTVVVTLLGLEHATAIARFTTVASRFRVHTL